VLRVREAGTARHVRQRQVGLDQEPLGELHPALGDRLVDGPVQGLAEPSLEHAAGRVDVGRHVFHAEIVPGVLADEPEGPGHQRVADRLRQVGRAPDGDADRGHVGPLARSPPAAHQRVQQGGRLVADPSAAGDDAGERRVGQLAGQDVVIHPHHRRVVGHGEAGSAAGVERLYPDEVVAGHHAQRPGPPREPLRQAVRLRLPRGLLVAPGDGARGPVLLAREARRAGGGEEAVAAAVGPLEAGVADEREPLEPPLPQVLQRHRADGLVVALDVREVGPRGLVVHVHRGDARLEHGLGELRREPRDDPVAPPRGQPRRRRVLQRAVLEEDRPGPVLAQVLRHPVEHLAAVGHRRLDQDRHVGRPRPSLGTRHGGLLPGDFDPDPAAREAGTRARARRRPAPSPRRGKVRRATHARP
ncbi:hypothetical protein HK102_009446, partial [Quaeritorhiza haematococci]